MDYEAWLDAPLKIDTSQPYPEPVMAGARRDALGGLKWSAPFERRVGSIVPQRVAEVRALRREWWQNAYICDRLAAHLGADILDALLRWRRDDCDYGSANRLTRGGKRNPGFLESQDRKARRYVRTILLPNNLPIAFDDDE